MAINNAAERRAFERRFFLAIAILFPIVVLVGFAPTYYLKPLFDSPPVPRTVVHLHAFFMAAWIVFFIAQVYFIRSTRIKTHQQLGLVSIILALGIIVTGIVTAVQATKYGSNSTPAGVAPLEFLAVPFFDMVVFAVLFGGAVYYRRNAPNHKRLMLLTVLNFLPPAIARFPFGLTAAFGPLWFFGVVDLLAIIFLAVDTWRNRKLNQVFLAGTIFLIASHWLRLAISSTAAWVSFATWLTSLGG
ncbi:MAG TPA: hypothetical protein VMZ26_00645 [Pyrinomonadaceae bacterium]|nr:hypothetical protein [Pyrinomonadaceae bacterium]